MANYFENRAQAIKHLEDNYPDDEPMVFNAWVRDDVASCNVDCGIGAPLTDQMCDNILRRVGATFDANMGINWETIQAAIDAEIGGY